ncbi:DUF1837 domain-containing protein [Glaesserella parasuis]|uniref:HamA C-terminal domain-containing protein n=1 Tax=Glaesserella parasuis TaxID=738 RepID=UPI0003AC0C8E|nr:DUF1837 domain-containing protein [Glaesserella parasuis]EQA05310.1 hypothetical protein HPS12939_1214 [Glaesserella parasuis 12939]MCT8559923.1 DUF1837 domain-containing protein [Glaesserella parasuis]MCT8721639.1 DUF1837 domain-containing protein [Glaesserella parasuis]MCT8727917.1 DUF1837 domain-containing protein [Glaesserella parasuis]MCT8818096.1 DUF1837 domain-containing protein [Glaesserella parasuis]
MDYPKPPEPFLEVKVHDLTANPPVAALCAGYEGGKWRATQLAAHVMEWLPEFCLNAQEVRNLNSSNALKMLRKAARQVYQTEKHKNRGEFGEIFLHIALRQIYNSIPAISKIYYKDSVNGTVKGFDAVHVIKNDSKLELWLGEVKFYPEYNRAINDVVKELVEHTKDDYLRNENMFILNKIDDKFSFYPELSKLLDTNTSLDDIFDCVCIPILITYDSETLKNNNKRTDKFNEELKVEVMRINQKMYDKLSQIKLPPVRIHLFLLPLQDKSILINALDKELKDLQ